MEAIGRIAGRLDDAAAALTAGARILTDLESTGPRDAAGPGRLGELDDALRARLAGALAARAAESTAGAGQLVALADDVRTAAARYDTADQRAADRHRREH